MFPLILSLCFASIFCGCVSGDNDKNYALYFPKKGVSDYVNIWDMPNMTQITVCFWMKSSVRVPGTMFSYSAPPKQDNEFVIFIYNGIFRIWLGGESSDTRDYSINDGKWHHVCVSWQSSDGAYKYYRDGVMQRQGTINQGHTIRGGGCLVLGQEQDHVGGGFNAFESFQGYLVNLNVWSYVLPEHAISQQSGAESCLLGRGDVFKWSDFRCGLKGDVRKVTPSPCLLGN